MFGGLYECLPAMLLALDDRGRIVWSNRAAQRMLGYPAGQLEGAHFSELLCPGDFASAFARLWNESETDGYPLFVRTAEGRSAALSVSTSRREGRTFLSAVERKHMSETARRCELQRCLIEQDPRPALLASPDGIVLLANSAYQRAFGEVRSGDSLPPSYPLDRWRRNAARLLAGRDVQPGLFSLGEMQLSERLAIVESGLIAAYYCDESVRVRLEEHLRQARKMEALGLMAGGLVHDFNNVLTVIQGFADLLPAELEEADGIREAARLASAMSSQILTLSGRREEGGVAEVVDLNGVVRSLFKILDVLVGRDVSVELDLTHGECPVLGKRGQLAQILVNVATNARDAMPEGGRFTIRTALDGDATLLELSDTGTGMDESLLNRIFEPFYTTKGTGLGLFIVYGIVSEAGGEIDVQSQPGVGTRFRIRLPLPSGFAPG